MHSDDAARQAPADDAAIAQALWALLQARAPAASVCPSDAARALGGSQAEWRARMPAVRAVAAELARQGLLSLTRGALTLDPHDPEALLGGPLRVRRGPRFPHGPG